MRIITFKIEEGLLVRVDEFAVDKNMTRSEVIRRALRSYLRSHVRPVKTRRLVVYS